LDRLVDCERTAACRVAGHTLEPHVAQELEGVVPRLWFRVARAWQPQPGPHEVEVVGMEPAVIAGEDVVQHSHPRPELDVLEGAGDSAADDVLRTFVEEALAAEDKIAALHRVKAADYVEKCRLAGAIWSDQTNDGVIRHVEGNRVEGDDADEAHSKVAYFEELHKPESKLKLSAWHTGR